METAALATSLRDFVRVLELDAIPASLAIPKQGSLRSLGAGGKGGGGAIAGGGLGGASMAHPPSFVDTDEAERP